MNALSGSQLSAAAMAAEETLISLREDGLSDEEVRAVAMFLLGSLDGTAARLDASAGGAPAHWQRHVSVADSNDWAYYCSAFASYFSELEEVEEAEETEEADGAEGRAMVTAAASSLQLEEVEEAGVPLPYMLAKATVLDASVTLRCRCDGTGLLVHQVHSGTKAHLSTYGGAVRVFPQMVDPAEFMSPSDSHFFRFELCSCQRRKD